MHPDANFRNRSGAKIHVCCKKTRNGSRGTNSCIKCASIPVFAMCQLRLWNGMEPPKTCVLDWNSGFACSLRQNKKWFWRHKLVHLMHPILIFKMGQVRQWNGVKPPETRVLDIKYVVQNQTDILEHRNGVQIPKMWVSDLKECIEIFHVVCLESYCFEKKQHSIKCTPILVSATGRVRRRNGAKPSKTWVLDLK